eukprot:5039853-Pyramimonas_sp.AAC.1
MGFRPALTGMPQGARSRSWPPDEEGRPARNVEETGPPARVAPPLDKERGLSAPAAWPKLLRGSDRFGRHSRSGSAEGARG